MFMQGLLRFVMESAAETLEQCRYHIGHLPFIVSCLYGSVDTEKNAKMSLSGLL